MTVVDPRKYPIVIKGKLIEQYIFLLKISDEINFCGVVGLLQSDGGACGNYEMDPATRVQILN